LSGNISRVAGETMAPMAQEERRKLGTVGEIKFEFGGSKAQGKERDGITELSRKTAALEGGPQRKVVLVITDKAQQEENEPVKGSARMWMG
jgi:hypothetical protein